jgi:nitroimidazol reductase NimA-like FMN-containing flavoprotein (pyridoxamine 5'-phosphate oxidase superfamily)
MEIPQGDLALIADPAAQRLLASEIPARLAYVALDGTPRNVPIWFHWNGRALILVSPQDAQKVDALRARPQVAITMDGNEMPYEALMIRGVAEVEPVSGIPSEYALAAKRYLGEAGGEAWVEQIRALNMQSVRITVTPQWVGLLDFQTRFPREVAKLMPRDPM